MSRDLIRLNVSFVPKNLNDGEKCLLQFTVQVLLKPTTAKEDRKLCVHLECISPRLRGTIMKHWYAGVLLIHHLFSSRSV